MISPNGAAINPNGANGNPYHARFHDLLDRHYQVLARGSGIADDVIGERGYRSVIGGADLQALDFSPNQRSRVPGILVPMHGSDGSGAGCQFRPDWPRTDTMGREAKYETPVDATTRLDVPPRCRASIGDASVPLWITEGVKKGDALASHGLCAAALAGVWMFRTKASNDTKPLLADFDYVTLKGRAVFVVYDSDVIVKPPVQKALDSLMGHLKRKGAVPTAIYLPAADDGSKVGVDDFLLNHTVDELKALVGQPKPAAAAQPASPTMAAAATAMGAACPFIPGTDLAAAHIFADLHGCDLRHVKAWERWFIFDNSRWLPDETGEIWRRARDMPPAVAKVSDWSEKLSGRSKLAAMVGMAESDARIAIRHTDLDRDAMLFNTASGTIGLKTGDLRPAERADLITKISPVVYDPAAACPQFDRFLEEILPDPEVREYLQRWFGYCLTGDVSEHRVSFWHGTGANGKSVLASLLLHILGEYGHAAPLGFLDKKDGNEHPTAIADLKGARGVVCSETEQDSKMAETMVKQQTGGDRLKARRMREDFWEFDPTHKLTITGNHKPQIRGADNGIWRRLDLVLFNVTIELERQDHHLIDKLKAEAAGVLAWMVRGCLDWQKHGLPRPRAIVAATDDYRAESDQLRDFLNEYAIIAPTATVEKSQLNRMYQAWATAAGEKQAFSPRGLTTALKERGFKESRPNHHSGWIWLGIGLRNAPVPPPDEEEPLAEELPSVIELGPKGQKASVSAITTKTEPGTGASIYGDTGISGPSGPLAPPSDPPPDVTANAPDFASAILDRAERFGWRTLIVGPAEPGQLMVGGSEGSWRRWVAEHSNGERAAVLVALRAEVQS